jgi:hypothetical protein
VVIDESAPSMPEPPPPPAPIDEPALSISEPEPPPPPDIPEPERPHPPASFGPVEAPPAPQKPAGPLPGDLPSFKLDDNPLGKLRRLRKSEVKPVPEINLAGAIDAYLQYKLQNTPEYVERSIHILPASDGGVSIEVDGRYYDAVGDVADEAVRNFIGQAIEEWQERH